MTEYRHQPGRHHPASVRNEGVGKPVPYQGNVSSSGSGGRTRNIRITEAA